MKLVNIISKLVGALFIFSGLIKLNDPYGTAYKLEEYFEVFAADGSSFFLYFIPFSLFLSIFISAFEVILGVALLITYRMKITAWISLILISFFTFLTYYSFAYDKVKDCGCFGTAIKLTPQQSFYKDLILLIFIIIIFLNQKRLKVNIGDVKALALILLVTLASFGLGYYSVHHLPYMEPTPYKVGADLHILTKPQEIARYEWIMEKDGKEFRFDNEHYPSDPAYKYKGKILLTDSMLLTPKIASFMIYNQDGDFTEEALKGRKLLITISNPEKAMQNCDVACTDNLNHIARTMESKGVKTMILTVPDSEQIFENYRHQMQLRGDYYYTDDVVLKTMVRSNPGIMLLQDGIIKGKWHFNHIPNIEKLNNTLTN